MSEEPKPELTPLQQEIQRFAAIYRQAHPSGFQVMPQWLWQIYSREIDRMATEELREMAKDVGIPAGGEMNEDLTNKLLSAIGEKCKEYVAKIEEIERKTQKAVKQIQEVRGAAAKKVLSGKPVLQMGRA